MLASTQVFPRVRLERLEPERFSPRSEEAERDREERIIGGARLLPGSSPLLLLLSDTAGRHWWNDGSMFMALRRWAHSCPTALLHPLPLSHWGRTALALARRASVRNTTPASANPAYRADPLNWWLAPAPPGRDLPLPVVPLERRSLAIWSAVVMGNPAFATSGVALPDRDPRGRRRREVRGDRDLDPSPRDSVPTAPAPDAPISVDPEARWLAFAAMASPQAQRLLLAMASAPLLTLPVIELLKEVMVPEATGPLPIAEVLMGGLLVRQPGQEATEEGSRRRLRTDQLQFALAPELAAWLRERHAPADRLEVIRRVSALVERRWNRTRQSGEPSFEALLCDPTISLPEGMRGVVPFASVTARLLEGLPGDRARAFAERIRQGSGLPPPASPWPAAMAFEEWAFDTGQLVTARPVVTIAVATARFVEVELRPIAFTTARVSPTGEVRRWTAEARAFHEPLRRDTLPLGATAERADPLALTLVEIPAGDFLMGCGEGEDGYSDEKPQHRVRLEGFFMGQTPITQAQWRAVAEWREREGERWGRELKASPSRFLAKGSGEGRLLEGEASTEQRPVERVSWEEAMEFCHRLSQRTGHTYTLPSEAQWEYVCRAGGTTPFAFGDTLTAELANYNATFAYANGPTGRWRGQTTPVGIFPTNAWGLHDMHGNVWEWCLDEWKGSYERAPMDGSAWVTMWKRDDKRSEKEGTERGEKNRLLRGGSWGSPPEFCRSAYRNHFAPVDADDFVGFRVVCLPQDPSLLA